MIEKYKSRRIRAEIRRVLMEKWDPIGVADVSEASDEYDSYVGGVFELLQKYATSEMIEEYLLTIETHNMGLTGANGAALLAHPLRFAAADELQHVFHEQMLID